MDDNSSNQPIFDAVAGSADGNIPQLNLTPAGAQLDASYAGPAFAGGGFSLASIPSWAWLALGAVILFKMVR